MLLREKFDEMATSNRGASENRSDDPGASESEPSPMQYKNKIWDAFTDIIEESGRDISEMTKLKNTCLSHSLTSIEVIVSHGGLIMLRDIPTILIYLVSICVHHQHQSPLKDCSPELVISMMTDVIDLLLNMQKSFY